MLRKILHRFSHISASKPQSLALYVGSSVLSLAETSNTKIEHSVSVSYGPGKLPAELSRILSAVSSGSQLRIVLAPDFYQLVQLDKPVLADTEMLQALPWQVKDLVTIAPEDMVADYIDLPAASGAQSKINVVAASFSWLQPLVQQVTQAGIEVVSIEPEEWLASRLIAPTSQATMLVIHQPAQEVLIQIVRNGVLYFSRRTRGFSSLDQKASAGFNDGTLDRLQLELQRSLDYFESQLKQAPVRDIRLLMTEAPLMCELLAQSGFSRVEPLTEAMPDSALTTEQLLQCWPAAAALMPHMAELS